MLKPSEFCPEFAPKFAMITLKSGVKSLRSLEYGETFHPVTGPQVEARILHVEQQRLVERASAVSKFVIWDVGFGAAANAITAIEALLESKTEVELHSFDKTTSPIEFALLNASALGYVATHEETLRRLLSEQKIAITPKLTWHLHLGDFRELLKTENLPDSPHAIFYDPYSPVGNPEMWTLEHFTQLRSRLDPTVPCLLTNYTRSTSMRVALLMAGFHVGTGCEVGEKAETTVASTHLDLLEHPLRPQWLDRVRVSGNSAPLRGVPYSQGKITETDLLSLQSLAQFQVSALPSKEKAHESV